MFFVIFLQFFFIFLYRAIKIDKMDSINRKYKIMVVNILKNLSQIYYNHHSITFIKFIPIYYVINLDIISSFIILAICILDVLIYYKFESIKLMFL